MIFQNDMITVEGKENPRLRRSFMKEKTRKTRVPAYLKDFRCIGSPCEDNCCIGWDVDFDKKSYQKYAKIKDGELGKLFSTSVKPNADSYSDDVDFASVRLRKNKVCAFLNEEHLCKIQLRFGETYLSNVCATYPRYTNHVNDVYEHSATVSCPEAARIILGNPLGISFVMGEEIHGTRHIITYEADTRARANPLRVRYLLELREFSIELLQDRSKPLRTRILFLGKFCDAVRLIEMKKSKTEIPLLIETFRKQYRTYTGPKKGNGGAVGTGQLTLLKDVISSLNVFSEIDSRRYIDYTREFIKGIGIEDENSNMAETIRQEGFQKYYAPFMEKREYLLENYLVNFVFKDLFPAAEGLDAFDAYMMLVIRFSLIKLHLIGIGIHRKGLTEETVVGFIQAFSKTVEHHKTYLESIADHMIQSKYNSIQYMTLLLQE